MGVAGSCPKGGGGELDLLGGTAEEDAPPGAAGDVSPGVEEDAPPGTEDGSPPAPAALPFFLFLLEQSISSLV